MERGLFVTALYESNFNSRSTANPDDCSTGKRYSRIAGLPRYFCDDPTTD